MKTSENIGEGIDRLVNLDLTGRGVIYKLYDAARKRTGSPLALTAAQMITEVMNEGDNVIIATGFRVPPGQIQETDGPLGAAALARAFAMTFDAKPLLLIEKASTSIMKATLNGAGMKAVSTEKIEKIKNKRSAAVIGYPLDVKSSNKNANRILDKYDPSVLIAIEKSGRNQKGEYHTMRGLNVSSIHAKVEPLFEEARKNDLLTIAIGDGGNEIGMGNIKNQVEDFVPNAKMCQCPCKAGIAAESKVDLLVTAAISNWGAYGIEASIAQLTGKSEILHSPEIERLMLEKTVDAGAIDGTTGRNELSVDGAPASIHLLMIRMLRALIGAG